MMRGFLSSCDSVVVHQEATVLHDAGEKKVMKAVAAGKKKKSASATVRRSSVGGGVKSDVFPFTSTLCSSQGTKRLPGIERLSHTNGTGGRLLIHTNTLYPSDICKTVTAGSRGRNLESFF